MKDKKLIGALALILIIMLTMMYFHGRNNYYNGYEKGYNFGHYIGDLDGCIDGCEYFGSNHSYCSEECDNYLYEKSNPYYDLMDINLSDWKSENKK